MDLSMAWRRPRLIAAAACFLLGAALIGASLYLRRAPAELPAATLSMLPLTEVEPLPALAAEAPGDVPGELIVYVTGAVHRPDVYRLGPSARVKDAVVAAGGLREDAAAEQINLAELLGDAAHVHVPLLGPIVAPVREAAPAGSSAASSPLLDLNTASEAGLEELPGVGPTLAARIVARRVEQGPYGAVEELREVSGVGEKLYAQIAPLVTVRP